MFYNLCSLFLIFFIASFIGYFVEIAFCSIKSHKMIFNRGFLMGPYIPIYGVGTVLVAKLLYQYKDDPFIFFWMTVILCSFVEYLTSYIMEKLFKVRWWDYSDEPFNYNGRICLKNSMIFGISGLLVVYTLYPFILKILSIMNKSILEIIAVCLFIIFITDLVFTVLSLYRVKNNLIRFAGTDVTEKAHEEVTKVVKEHLFSLSRLLQAFPHTELFNKKEYKEFRKIVLDYKNKRKINSN